MPLGQQLLARRIDWRHWYLDVRQPLSFCIEEVMDLERTDERNSVSHLRNLVQYCVPFLHQLADNFLVRLASQSRSLALMPQAWKHRSRRATLSACGWASMANSQRFLEPGRDILQAHIPNRKSLSQVTEQPRAICVCVCMRFMILARAHQHFQKLHT